MKCEQRGVFSFYSLLNVNMGENLEKIVLSYAPEYWQTGVGNIVQLRTHFPEYGVIFTEVSQAIQSYNASIKTIKRCQNVHDFGQFLVREQHLLHLNPSKTYYRVSYVSNDY